VSALARARFVDVVVVAAPADGIAEVRALLALHEMPAEVEVVAGGPTRQDSVRGALAALPETVDVVLVHDAARPLAPSELADAVVTAVRAGAEAVVPGLPVTDTVKRIDAAGLVTETVDRTALRAVQTPQGFRRSVLAAAHAAAAPGVGAPADPRPATDDAELVERLGHPVVLIAGAEEAFKVTRPLDLVLAETVLARRRLAGAR
jgi:2-C-methyl-D-erythritol 4-phosphate cytidylyltransferase